MNISKALAKDLKRTNFVFGYDAADLNSQYRRHYPKRELEGRSASVKGPSRKENIVLGTDGAIKQTEAAHHFKDFSGTVSSEQDTSTTKEHKKTHFSLGFERPEYATTATKNYLEKPMTSETNAQYTQNLAESYKNNILFGNDRRQMNSIQQSYYPSHESTETGNFRANSIKQYQKSAHFSIGTAPSDFRTRNGLEFAPKPLSVSKPFHRKENNIDLGQMKTPFETTTKSAYKQFAVPVNNQSRSLSVENRKANFSFNLPSEFETTSRAMHKKFPINLTDAKKQNRKSTLHMGGDSGNYESSYQKSFNSLEQSEKQELLKPSNQPNIHLGFHDGHGISEAKSHFKGERGDINTLNPEKEKHLKGTHIDLGRGEGNYQTLYKNYGTGNGQQNSLDEKKLKDLRATHFSIGNHKQEYITENSKQFGSKPVAAFKAASRDFNINVSFGKDPDYYTTIYRLNYNS